MRNERMHALLKQLEFKERMIALVHDMILEDEKYVSRKSLRDKYLTLAREREKLEIQLLIEEEREQRYML